MNHTHHINRFPGNSKQSAIVTIQKVTVVRSQVLVFWDQRTSPGKKLQRLELFFHLEDESISVSRTVCGNKTPDRLNIHFCSTGDPNFESCGHA